MDVKDAEPNALVAQKTVHTSDRDNARGRKETFLFIRWVIVCIYTRIRHQQWAREQDKPWAPFDTGGEEVEVQH